MQATRWQILSPWQCLGKAPSAEGWRIHAYFHTVNRLVKRWSLSGICVNAKLLYPGWPLINSFLDPFSGMAMSCPRGQDNGVRMGSRSRS